MASSYVVVCFFLVISLFSSFSKARQISVGGKNSSWSIPSSSAQTLNQWAEQTRFLVGDVLVWKYDPKKDSVLQVTQKDYRSCNISNPIASYADGNTAVTIDRPGPFYFISGAKGSCEKEEKLVVVVLTPRAPAPVASAPAPASESSVAPHPTSSAARLGGFTSVLGTGSIMLVVLM